MPFALFTTHPLPLSSSRPLRSRSDLPSYKNP